jgi:hypothetical protein
VYPLQAEGALGSPDLLAEATHASVANSHTNYWLRVVKEGVLHEGSQKFCINGRLSLGVAHEKDPALWEGCMNGIVFREISPSVVQRWPGLPDLVQRAFNTKTQRGEHDMQILRRIHSLIVKHQDDQGTVPFAPIKSKVLQSKPACAASVWQPYTKMILNTA